MDVVEQELSAEFDQALLAQVDALDQERQRLRVDFRYARYRRHARDGNEENIVADAEIARPRLFVFDGDAVEERTNPVADMGRENLFRRAVIFVDRPVVGHRAVRRDDDEDVGDLRIGDAGAEIRVDPFLVALDVRVVAGFPPGVVVGELLDVILHGADAAEHHGLAGALRLLVLLGRHPQDREADRHQSDDDLDNEIERYAARNRLEHARGARPAGKANPEFPTLQLRYA